MLQYFTLFTVLCLTFTVLQAIFSSCLQSQNIYFHKPGLAFRVHIYTQRYMHSSMQSCHSNVASYRRFQTTTKSCSSRRDRFYLFSRILIYKLVSWHRPLTHVTAHFRVVSREFCSRRVLACVFLILSRQLRALIKYLRSVSHSFRHLSFFRAPKTVSSFY